MKRILRNIGIFIAYFMLTMLMLSTTAFAYIDPAATSYVVQIVAGVVIAFGVTIGVFWKRVRQFFKNMKIRNIEKSLIKKAEKKKES